MKQNERLLEHLQRFAVTPLDALVILGIYRLAARVCELKKEGHNIEKRMVDVRNKFGETVKVAEYTLKETK